MDQYCLVRVAVQTHRSKSGRHRGIVVLGVDCNDERRSRQFPFVYHHALATYVVSVVNDLNQQLTLFRVAGYPLYRELDSMDIAYPELRDFAKQMSFVLRAGLCAHMCMKYPLTKLGTVAPLVCQMADQAVQDTTQKRGTAWFMKIDRALAESILRLPDVRLTDHYAQQLLQFCKTKQRAK